MEARSTRELTLLLPVKVILPTLTLGPSLMAKLTWTLEGGMVLTSVRTVAN